VSAQESPTGPERPSVAEPVRAAEAAAEVPTPTGPSPRVGHKMSAREVATVIAGMGLFVGTGTGVILRSAEAASVAFGLGLVVAAIVFVFISARDRAGKEEK
jgi:hypothetical protein